MSRTSGILISSCWSRRSRHCGRVLHRYRLKAAVTLAAVPNGNAVSPPELAADAPVADVFHPIDVDSRVNRSGTMLDLTLGRPLRRGRIRRWYPAGRGCPGLMNHCLLTRGSTTVVAPLAMADGVAEGVRYLHEERPWRIQLRHHVFCLVFKPLLTPAYCPAASVRIPRCRPRPMTDDDLQVVTLAYFEVDNIVTRRHLQHTRPELNGSMASSPTTGMGRPDEGAISPILPNSWLIARDLRGERQPPYRPTWFRGGWWPRL